MDDLPMSGRFTMANMAIEAGAKAGLFCVDQTTKDYLSERSPNGPWRERLDLRPDPGARYEQTMEINVTDVLPQVALPHAPDNVRPVREVEGVAIDQVVIGSCTNGRIDDLREAAEILRGRQVAPRVRCIVLPGSQGVLLQAVREGLMEVFIEAGAAVSTPTCGPCLGGHMGVLAAGERALATTNRNFRGRMGHPDSEVYLAGPAVAAASAVVGRIASPEEVLT